MKLVDISIIIRTLNEERHLNELLFEISNQNIVPLQYEVIIVDSGSTDKSLLIAEAYNCKIIHISRKDFTFGRSLNIGCEAALGKYVVMISGHCIPTNKSWLKNLISPLRSGIVQYSYGRQIGRNTTHFSEKIVFQKYYPIEDKIPQIGFFCNNANSAILKEIWREYKFDEELTGLEDMELGKRLVNAGGYIGYVSTAIIFHVHNESWFRIKMRYKREALALQKIMPEIHVGIFDIIRYIVTGIFNDLEKANKEGNIFKYFMEIIRFRIAQYVGSYLGNHSHRKVSNQKRELYFYPRKTIN